jgi:hypothetical protein
MRWRQTAPANTGRRPDPLPVRPCSSPSDPVKRIASPLRRALSQDRREGVRALRPANPIHTGDTPECSGSRTIGRTSAAAESETAAVVERVPAQS